MKGVILAGGTGSRLFPLTKVTNKHLLPVYDRPMIYYPIECMAKAGIDQVLLVTGGNNAGDFQRLLGDGREFGLKELRYTYQERAGGIAEALGLAETFAAGGPICLILGDTILQYSIAGACQRFCQQREGAKILLAEVDDPSSFGVAELAADGTVTRIVEKPKQASSNLAVIGVYFYDSHVFDIIRMLKPSSRNELEITDVNNAYVARGTLTAERIAGYWVDAGESIDDYLKACNTVAAGGANRELA
ncbi:MAG TPA: sugar phosphate nucleotidyltransferase [Tepidisphaeraceae bacterium]|jgi:glucose-1-phosphate thymidylyltransferase|nr:sugar phosphate nucleotidyltransferase [Tepidisphaeraceae bacterium]